MNKSFDIVTIRGTNVPLEETLSIGIPEKKLGWMEDLMPNKDAPTVVDGVVVMRRPDFWRPCDVSIPFIVVFE